MSSDAENRIAKDDTGFENTNVMQVSDVVQWMRDKLKVQGVIISSDSLLNNMLLFLDSHKYAPTSEELEDSTLRSQWLEAAGTLYVVRKVKNAVDAANALGQMPQADAYNAHIQLLTKGRAAQNIGGVRDDASNKLMELLIAVSCAEKGKDVELDDPNVSCGGANPDVLVTLNGRRVGLACKTAGSTKEGSWWQLIEHGVGQVNAAGKADIGCVVLNLKNAIDHATLLYPMQADASEKESLRRPYCNTKDAIAALEKQSDILYSRLRALLVPQDIDEVKKTFSESKAIPAILAFCQSAVLLEQIGHLKPCTVTTCALWYLVEEDQISKADLQILQAIIHGLNRIEPYN